MAAAHAITQAAKTSLQLTQVTAYEAQVARQQVTRKQGTHGQPAPPAAAAASTPAMRGDVNVSKRCGCCGEHKAHATGHTNISCLTHC